ncbi:T9SS type A sorting domain-containing protein [Flammeovirgaceae bacterium SG7u.111]|nr:T9SS type A sorting domain-containing protein [Flammeovirgaceae bacterium SG7u.132]WPO38650.1 T9SS type A sorting domain-containing protein [Flammeovirgaceae bacterium SG7u.111]
MKAKFTIVFLLAFAFFQANAANYYVAKDGSDSNDGSKAAPFLTISKAASLMVAGDTCFVKAGTYREVLSPANAGQAGSPIVFTNYADDSVVISATEVLDTWSISSGNIYQADYAMGLGRQNMIFCNGKPMDWARWPNNDDDDPYTVQGVKVESGTGSTIVGSEIPDKDWVGGYIWYLGAHSGTSWTRKITANAGNTISFTEVDISKWPFNPHNPTVLRNENRGQFFLFGAKDALDFEREWYYDEDEEMVYFQAPGNADPNGLEVEVAQRVRTMDIGNDYIVVDGINAFGGKIEIRGSNCVIRNGTFKNCLQILDELDNTDAQVGDATVLVRASNTIIEHNVIDGGSLNGVFVQGWGGVTSVTIQHNVIKNFNTVGIHSSPVRSSATNVKIHANTIMNTGRDGMYNGGTDCEISYNDISNCMLINNDGGVFYTVGNDNPKNTEIHHNWFHDSAGPDYADGRVAGIYLDNDSKGYSVHHNVVWNVTWSGLQMNWDVWDHGIYHNTFWHVEQAMGTWLKAEHEMQRDTIYNNYASIGDWAGTLIDHNVIDANDPFTDLAAQNFTPKKESSLFDTGVKIAGINDDFQGDLPDVGAYEYGLSPWKPGVDMEVGGEVIIDVETGIEDYEQAELNVLVYPNPSFGQNVRVEMKSKIALNSVEVFNGLGQRVQLVDATGIQVTIPFKVFEKPGLYFIKINSQEKSWLKKLIVN